MKIGYCGRAALVVVLLTGIWLIVMFANNRF